MADDAAPMRKIDDATYGAPPESRGKRRLLRARRWFQLDANRLHVAGLLLVASFVVIVLVGEFAPVPVRSFLTNGISPGAVLVELLKTIVSVVVIVLSINQLVLSPGLGPVGDQRERYDQSVELRRRVEAHTGTVASPSSPALFLGVLVDAIVDQAARLEEVTADVGDPELRAKTGAFADDVTDDGTAVASRLSAGRFGEFEVVSAALRFSITERVRTLQAIRDSHGESAVGPVADRFDELEALLELFTIAREYFKTVYIREEYISLSESLLYTGLPAIVATYCAAQIYTPTIFPGSLLGVERRLLFVAGAVTVSLTPFVVLVAYVFRLTAMSRSTLFVGPFAARKRSRDASDHGGDAGADAERVGVDAGAGGEATPTGTDKD